MIRCHDATPSRGAGRFGLGAAVGAAGALAAVVGRRAVAEVLVAPGVLDAAERA